MVWNDLYQCPFGSVLTAFLTVIGLCHLVFSCLIGGFLLPLSSYPVTGLLQGPNDRIQPLN